MSIRKLTAEEIAAKAKKDADKRIVTPVATDAYKTAMGVAALEDAINANESGQLKFVSPYADTFRIKTPEMPISDVYQPKTLDEIRNTTTPVGNVGGSAGDVDTAEKEEAIVPTESGNNVMLDDKIDPNIVPSTKDVIGSAFMANLIKDLGYTEEQKKADERRKKAAQWVAVAQMLGDSLGALGNVINVGHGAVSQTMEPGALKAGTATYQLDQDIRAAQEKARKAQYDAILKKYEMEWEKEKADRLQSDSDRKHDETVRHNKAVEEISRLGAENAANSHKVAMYNAETSRLNAGTAARNASVNEAEERRKAEQYNKQHGDRKFLIGDQWVNIPKDKWEGVVGSIYNSLPEEVRKVYETQVTDELGIKKETRKAPTIAVMDAAVRQYAQDPAVMKAILKAAGIKTEGVGAKKDKRDKENTSTNNTEPPIQAYSAPADEWGSQWRRRAGLDTTDFSQFKRK